MAVTLFCLLLTTGVILLSSCGDDEAETDTKAAPGTTSDTASAGDEDPSAAEINIYVEQVRELVQIGDQLNVAYRETIERYNQKETPAEEVIAAAEQNAVAYGDMISQLEGMTVPEELESVHEMIIAGFDKWREMYELDARGLEAQDAALLDQARSLDKEAVSEVNDAIDEINRLKEND